jgi:hypothetical protein
VFSYQTVYMHISGTVVSPGQAYNLISYLEHIVRTTCLVDMFGAVRKGVLSYESAMRRHWPSLGCRAQQRTCFAPLGDSRSTVCQSIFNVALCYVVHSRLAMVARRGWGK